MLEISGKHPDSTDEELLQLFDRNGSLDTLGVLYSRYMHLVYGVALKYLGDRDHAQDRVGEHEQHPREEQAHDGAGRGLIATRLAGEDRLN